MRRSKKAIRKRPLTHRLPPAEPPLSPLNDIRRLFQDPDPALDDYPNSSSDSSWPLAAKPGTYWENEFWDEYGPQMEKLYRQMFGNIDTSSEELSQFYRYLLTDPRTRQSTRTDHQWQVFIMLYRDRLSYKEIESRLDIKAPTIKFHIRAIERKFGADLKTLFRKIHDLEREFTLTLLMKLAKLKKVGHKMPSV